VEPAEWSVSDPSLARIVSVSEDKNTVIIDIVTGFSNEEGFEISYGDLKMKVPIYSL